MSDTNPPSPSTDLAPPNDIQQQDIGRNNEEVDLPSSWEKIRDIARDERIKYSTTETQKVTPAMLLGSYFLIWESVTETDGYDGMTDEIIFLDLSMEKLGKYAEKESTETKQENNNFEASRLDDNTIREDVRNEYAKTLDAKTEEDDAKSIKKEGNAQSTLEEDFANVYGRFRWWQMIGTFKGLYRPEGASENVWYFGNVTWTHIAEGTEDEDREGEPEKYDEYADSKSRDLNNFGLAALVTLDDKGNPFLELMYNCTTYNANERAGRLKRGLRVSPDEIPAPGSLEHVYIVWKKQKKNGSRRPLEITNRERRRLINDGSIPTIEPAEDSPIGKSATLDDSESDESDEESESRPGMKRGAEDLEVATKPAKKVKV